MGEEGENEWSARCYVRGSVESHCWFWRSCPRARGTRVVKMKKKPEVRGRETPRTGGCDAFGVPAPRVETRAGPIAVVPCRFDAFALQTRPEKRGYGCTNRGNDLIE